MTPKQEAIAFLEGLKLDIEESTNGIIEIEKNDLEQIDNCLKLIKEAEKPGLPTHIVEALNSGDGVYRP